MKQPGFLFLRKTHPMRYLIFLFVPLFFAACNQPQKETSSEPETESQIPVIDDVAVPAGFSEVNFGDRAFDLPSNWITEPVSSRMRAAQFHIKEDSLVQLVFFYFGEQVGSADANLERWRNEYETLGNFDEETVGECGIRMVTAEGTFKKRASMRDTTYTAMPDYVTYAAIIPTEEGPYYFKTVGSKESLAKYEASIMAFLKSCRAYEAHNHNHDHDHEH